MLPRHLGGVQLAVMLCIGGFVAQQIAVGAGIKKRLVALAAALAQRQGDGAVGITLPHGGDDAAHALVGKPAVFPTLHHEGAEAEFVARRAALINLLFRQPIAHRLAVAAPQPAIEAVVAAIAGQLYQAAHENLVAIDPVGHLARRLLQILHSIAVVGGENQLQLIARKVTVLSYFVDSVHNTMIV